MFKCLVENCDAPKHKAKGYCSLHYGMVRRSGAPIARPYIKQDQTCTVDGCNSAPRARGLCDKHLQRFYTKGDPLNSGKGREYGSGKDWHINPLGYIVRYDPENPNAGPNGQVYQHRHVMAQVIGRPISKSENVHHINGDKADNDPKNLELWTMGQPSGQRIQDMTRWHIAELMRNADAALILDPSLKDDFRALAQTLKFL